MHFLVMIAAAVIILSFVSNNPGAVGKFIGGFVIGIVLFVIFAIFIMAIPQDHKLVTSKSTSLFAFDQAAVTSIYKSPEQTVVPSVHQLSDEDRSDMAKLLRYGQRRLVNKSQEKGQ